MSGDYRPMNDGDAPKKTKPARARDPFYVVRDKVQLLVASVKKDFEKWKDLLENTNTATNEVAIVQEIEG